MKKIIFKTGLLQCALVVFNFIAFTVPGIAGGDTYEVYLNNNLIVKQYVSQSNDVNIIPLSNVNINDEIRINYSHCGVTGKGRTIVIKSAENKIIKEWRFKDVAGSEAGMSIKVKDILHLVNGNKNITFNLYYFSSEYLPNGRMLTKIKLGGKNVAQNKTHKEELLSVFFPGSLGVAALGFLFWQARI